jgi:sucrose phosphorylase
MDWQQIEPILQQWGGDEQAWHRLFDKWESHAWHDHEAPSEKTNVLLVDASFVTTEGKPDMGALHDVLTKHVAGTISDLHLVSLFPYIGRQTDTAVDPRIRLYEDLGELSDDFQLMYELDPVAYNAEQFDLLAETDALIERLAYGATKVRVHAQSFRGMTREEVKDILRLWHIVLHNYKPNGQLILAEDALDEAESYLDVVDAVCHFDLASHVTLALAQGKATRLTEWARKIAAPPEGKTYFHFLSSAERDPFEKNLLDNHEPMLLAAHSILFSLQGIPSVDYRTLFGVSGPKDEEELVQSLKKDETILNRFSRIIGQLNVKRTEPALSPYAAQHILDVNPHVFAVEREMKGRTVRLYTNVSENEIELDVQGTNLFTGEPIDGARLQPFGYVWVSV